jgi:superfamily II DNA helicase RecQ
MALKAAVRAPNIRRVVTSKVQRYYQDKQRATVIVMGKRRNTWHEIADTPTSFSSFLFFFSFEQGISSAAFHGSVKNATKDENLTRWLSGEILVMCATVAFGMGVDKADVRFGAFVACREGQAAFCLC